MGIWRSWIFPRMVDKCMSTNVAKKHRPIVLSRAEGHVLEVGFGTGLNLPYYPSQVTRVTAFDVNPGMIPLAQKQIAASRITVDYLVLNGESLAFADNTFDTVVSTWTLCSIPKVDHALREIYRVLKPGGRFVFIEHGLSKEPTIQAWQRRLTPLQKKVADGCHFDRNFQTLLAALPFEIQRLDQFYAENTPRVVGYLYDGVACKV